MRRPAGTAAPGHKGLILEFSGYRYPSFFDWMYYYERLTLAVREELAVHFLSAVSEGDLGAKITTIIVLLRSEATWLSLTLRLYSTGSVGIIITQLALPPSCLLGLLLSYYDVLLGPNVFSAAIQFGQFHSTALVCHHQMEGSRYVT